MLQLVLLYFSWCGYWEVVWCHCCSVSSSLLHLKLHGRRVKLIKILDYCRLQHTPQQTLMMKISWVLQKLKTFMNSLLYYLILFFGPKNLLCLISKGFHIKRYFGIWNSFYPISFNYQGLFFQPKVKNLI